MVFSFLRGLLGHRLQLVAVLSEDIPSLHWPNIRPWRSHSGSCSPVDSSHSFFPVPSSRRMLGFLHLVQLTYANLNDCNIGWKVVLSIWSKSLAGTLNWILYILVFAS